MVAARGAALDHMVEEGGASTNCEEANNDAGGPDMVHAMLDSLREEAAELWHKGGGPALLEMGQPTAEYAHHLQLFTHRLLAEALQDMLNDQTEGSVEPTAPEKEPPLAADKPDPASAGLAGVLERRDKLSEVRKKDSPEESDELGQAAREHAQHVQRLLVESNLRDGKPQRTLAAASERLEEPLSWEAPEPRAGAAGPPIARPALYGNLYLTEPPLRLRCVADGFATAAECREACGHCIQGMHCMFRRGGQTSLAVSRELLGRRLGEEGCQLVCQLVERTRLRIIQDFGLPQDAPERPALFESGGLLTRLQAEWERDVWEISGEEEHVYWNAHVDKANVASYDYAALLYLSTQGEHHEGGDFAFIDADVDCVVSPRRGRLLAFTAGPENLHQVRRVTRGTRFVLAMWFTLSEKHRGD
ncbi:unnamed protein product [Prorocentrum cordatum]|uniref:Fe2OG dioxygenase domain-containing protein n=1 Tax=Prorocentrum cordatum TaxID=2364126 RepID=A0ABN9US59_9DINO|nr:unnamed protein product [Polarella glacialis]